VNWCSATALVILAACQLRADDWPQWRGPKRDGVAPGTHFPDVWPKKPPKPLWKYKVGEGHCGPIVAGGKVFVMGRLPPDKEVCYCLDAATGKELWKRVDPAPYTPGHPAAGQGPKSTPTFDGDRVYMLGVAGLFHCFDAASGKVLWKHDFAKEFWGVEKNRWDDDAWSTSCGAAASPLVDGGNVLLPVGGKKAGGMTAFDRHNGKVVWKSLTDRSGYGSPVRADLAGVGQIIGFTALRMVGLRADGGALLWDRDFPARHEITILTPVVWKDLVVFGGERRPAVAVRVERSAGKVAGKVAWHNNDLRPYTVSPVVVRDYLFGHNARNQLVCVDLATGRTAWASGDFGTHVSLVAAGNDLLVLTLDKGLHVLEANPKKLVRKAHWDLPLTAPTWSHLAVAGNRLYIKDKTDLLCFQVPGG
jgi:outer membrane protein assembly factor BamB